MVDAVHVYMKCIVVHRPAMNYPLEKKMLESVSNMLSFTFMILSIMYSFGPFHVSKRHRDDYDFLRP